MRNAIIIVLVLILPLLAASVAPGQVANPPATTKQSAATTGQAAAPTGPTDPSRLTYARLYCTADRNSHFESVTVELQQTNFAPPAAPLYIGGNVAASITFFGGFEAGWGARDVDSRLYHPAPAAQFIVVLDGDFSITTTDGETRHFRPGDVLRLEDTPPCKGHITVVGDKPGYFLFAR